ncbi:unnamed protein product [Taenia asiatica]|uniref:Uncharacterized protein n=1 Tax=Taenia asiatica TaxID=60517 RepID=A0A0R3VWX7_TAEAS|nr:unnamed protein product [Taenia asiatica]
MGLVSAYADVEVTVRHVSLQIGGEKKEEGISAIGTRVMSARNSSSFLQPPSPVGVAGTGTSSTVGGQMQGSQQAEQSSSGVVRLHSVVARPSYVGTASTSNIFRSLSTIHRSTSLLPASLLDLSVASTAGLQVRCPFASRLASRSLVFRPSRSPSTSSLNRSLAVEGGAGLRSSECLLEAWELCSVGWEARGSLNRLQDLSVRKSVTMLWYETWVRDVT